MQRADPHCMKSLGKFEGNEGAEAMAKDGDRCVSEVGVTVRNQRFDDVADAEG